MALFRDYPGEPVPEEIFFCTFMVQGKITKADTPTIRLGATPSGLSSAHLCLVRLLNVTNVTTPSDMTVNSSHPFTVWWVDCVTDELTGSRLIMHRHIGGHCKHRPDAGTRRRKIWSRALKNKLRHCRNVVNKYQFSRKCMYTTRSMSDCTCVVVEIIMTVH